MTTVYGLANGKATNSLVTHTEFNSITDTAEDVWVSIAEIFGTNGALAATDFNATAIPATLGVQMSGGRAVTGGSGARKFVYVSSTTNVTGLTASSTNDIYLNRDGTFTAQVGGTAPANSHIVAQALTGVSSVSSVVNLPTGRVNLGGLRFAKDATAASITVGTEASNAIAVSIQFQDGAGNNLARKVPVYVWLSTTAGGAKAGTAPTGGWAATTGTKVEDIATNLSGRFLSNTSGLLVITLTDTGTPTFFVNVDVNANLYSSTAITFT